MNAKSALTSGDRNSSLHKSNKRAQEHFHVLPQLRGFVNEYGFTLHSTSFEAHTTASDNGLLLSSKLFLQDCGVLQFLCDMGKVFLMNNHSMTSKTRYLVGDCRPLFCWMSKRLGLYSNPPAPGVPRSGNGDGERSGWNQE